MTAKLTPLYFSLLLLTLVVGAVACRSEAPASSAAEPAAPPVESAAPGLEVHDAQAQLMGTMGAVYFTVVNGGSTPDRLLRVETPAAGAAETHESLIEDGVVRMRARPDGFEIPAAGVLTLEPGGKHVMLLEADPSVAATGKLPVTLVFEHAAPLEIEIELSGDQAEDTAHPADSADPAMAEHGAH